jgi:hypothetical protein
MRYECDAPGGKTWFRLETVAEAQAEAALMAHAVNKFFCRAEESAKETFKPGEGLERDIGLRDHIARTMPLFLTLRDEEGTGLVTAMVPRRQTPGFLATWRLPIFVGRNNTDPFPAYGEAIESLGEHLGITFDPAESYPYRRS